MIGPLSFFCKNNKKFIEIIYYKKTLYSKPLKETNISNHSENQHIKLI